VVYARQSTGALPRNASIDRHPFQRMDAAPNAPQRLDIRGVGELEPPAWRRALSGITPSAIAIIAALMLARSLGASMELLPLAIQRSETGDWIVSVFQGLSSLVVMVVPMLLIIVATANLGPRRGWRRVAALAAAVVASTSIGLCARIISGTWDLQKDWDALLGMVMYIWPRYVILGGMLTVVAELFRREVASTRAAQQAELDRIASERELTAATLQVLQAQIEPHFLFNTLANVRRLYAEHHADGRAMLGSLMRYLEVALPRMRRRETTLGDEADLIEAFLHIQAIRMGARLAFSVDIPRELRAHPVPPMMLLTLVENAIKHGLNPSPDGGRVRVAARVDADRLVLTVADTGVGFASASGSGIGLSNVSARLSSAFGEAAGLALENNELGGATATIALPLAQGGSAR
jgi:signal transduction histidine kinase